MLVRKSKYDAVKAENEKLTREVGYLKYILDRTNHAYADLLREFREKVDKLNQKIKNYSGSSSLPHQLSSSDIKKLIMLCHPDKHPGSKVAEDVTIMLIQLKNDIKK